MRLYFIINPSAGNGRGEKIWRSFENQLTVPYETYWTQYAGHTLKIAQQIGAQSNKENPVCIIAIGGDGTIHEVLNGAGNFEHVYIGAISAGSGNDFARGYVTFEHAQQVEQFLNNRKAYSYDYGIVTFNNQQKYFMNNFGIGFDALVANIANESKLKKVLNRLRLGKLSYPYFVIHALFTFKPFTITVIHNRNETIVDNVWFATVSNQPYFGGGMNLSPTSNPSDGQLEVTIVSNLSKWKLLFLFGSVFVAKHTKLKEVNQFSCRTIILKVSGPLLAHADGEKQLLNEEVSEIQVRVQRNAWKLAK
ncbi:MAG: diacylglycerol kinase family protein [Solibacillus sp.]|uniref:diacylglycerol/lipid kinase family protein n=1 Tax=unclassified Solibacillus TaxID=2637870 RepID=UPI0030F524B5